MTLSDVPSLDVRGVRVPALLYGTAWKEERTQALVAQALAAGFRGIDTANQRKHYFEAGVGAAVKGAIASGLVRREDLFLQSKFTHARGQDHRLPYDPSAPLAAQVEQSFASSLEHLGVESLDAYVLHGPSAFPGVGEADLEVWRAMEALHDAGRARLLGVSNVTMRQLAEIDRAARVKPAIVQNRTFRSPEADAAVRAFCAERGMAYEGFSLLTAIPHVVAHPDVAAIAKRHARTSAEVVLRWCLDRGMVVLTGTTSALHMAQDLSIGALDLAPEELGLLDRLLA